MGVGGSSTTSGGGGTDGQVVGKKMTRRRSGPPKVYSLKPSEALELVKERGWKWEYVKVDRAWKMKGPGHGDGPFAEDEVRERARTHACCGSGARFFY